MTTTPDDPTTALPGRPPVVVGVKASAAARDDHHPVNVIRAARASWVVERPFRLRAQW
jgi:hypothetical protein